MKSNAPNSKPNLSIRWAQPGKYPSVLSIDNDRKWLEEFGVPTAGLHKGHSANAPFLSCITTTIGNQVDR